MSKRRWQRSRRRGLTLIEILIVIAILLAMGGLVFVYLVPRKKEADADIVRVQMDAFAQALELFEYDLGRFPTEDEGIAALWNADLLEDEDLVERWKGPYLDPPVPQDRWNNEWVYRYPGEIRSEQFYDIVSPGPDREEGTEDDITNHDRILNEDGEVAEEFEGFDPADVQDR